ncbi:hypothetical protein SteCoe_22250 [Stentor coeruleus]|uniref:Glutamate--cysteine ligase n=1 Tax=Stentor coeruleus TaxID=5963 RepID=A0A1R2BMM6_9CILI|nr:hypothetical protein SteCoe_22250 [Stentor coeruleus]
MRTTKDVKMDVILECCPKIYEKIIVYLNLICKRANGELPTGAKFLRNLIRNHPDYKKDSIITSQIASDTGQIVKDKN